MRKDYTGCATEQLFALVKRQNDPVAFEELYNRYWFKLFLTAQKRLSSREEAEGAVQNLFESLWKNRKKISIHSSVENYLFAAIRYIILRTIYKRKRTASCPIEDTRDCVLSNMHVEETVVVNELTMHIDKMVAALPKKCRKVFELSRYEMKTHKEIAVIMGISEKTVENHITKALRLLKTNLNYFFLF